MLMFVLVALLAAIAAVLVVAARRPDNFHVERSIAIDAPAQRIFPLVNDLHQWDTWTPFNKDPAMTKTFSGSASGVGASYAWAGNRQVGRGDVTITASDAPQRVVFDLHMIEPFEGRNVGTIALKPAGPGTTTVIWSIDDHHTLMLKVMGLLVNLDRKIGGDFEAGLAKLKAIAERPA